MKPTTISNPISTSGQGITAGGVLGWGFFILASVALAYQIAQSHRYIASMKKDEESNKKKFAELEMNVRALRGTNYKNVA